MKKYIILLLICLGTCFQSCSDYLNVDRYFNDRQELERIFNSKDYTEEWLANAYFQLLNYNLEIGHIRYTITNFSDDAVFNEGSGGRTYADIRLGNYTPYHYSGSWRQSYDGIRQASIMIELAHPGDEISEEEYKDLMGQAYFIRGYLYWLLLRKYGPIPILPDKAIDYDDSYDDLSFPRSTYDECVEYISNQMKLAAELLPLNRDTRSASRPTRGAALAVRAKAYLYAASPLMNPKGDHPKEMADFIDDQGKQLISQEYDEGKWAKAAAAALDVIDLGQYKLYVAVKRITGSDIYPATVSPPEHPEYSHKDWPQGWRDIDPFESYRALFNGDLYVAENPEIIFTRGDNQLHPEYGILSISRHQMPQFGGGYNCHGVTGKQCDAYVMNDGKPFDRKTAMKGFTESDNEFPHLKAGVWKEYANREPRFYASIAYNGVVFPLASSDKSEYRNHQTWYYRGEQDGRSASSERWQPTGISMMKYVNPKDSYVSSGIAYPKIDPVIRYADILLMYAESLNELNEGSSYQVKSWDGERTYEISRDVAKMKEAILPVRLRAGLPNYDDINPQTYESQELLRKAIKHERQIEFLGENQRYYDLRRWLDAQEEEAKPIYGCNTFITKENAELFYEQVEIPHLVASFSRKMYFWPVTYDELQRNKRLTQAPGWQSFD
ncbi:RagB/SusD family nutrient uptake outer membrane protein [Dysgonomonas sp. Marseille-P4361]|uniref:RagB/SusD family nutrient uptake outer membrane protein n=1 Tax=Dysgonomonas sp. Marseille-P4361 TaxID=2161820 RepID=UPI000D54C2CA|nr:RagB/SusD family nutrient uptake outer membrane protein [Dysgonomonas sp. Marseille-P4361]